MPPVHRSSGAAGVGKSRLVREFTRRPWSDEAGVLRGRCLRYGEGITYWPIGEVVRSAAGIDEADTRRRPEPRSGALLDGERDADVIAARVASAIGLSASAAPAGGALLGDPAAPRAPRARPPAGRRRRGHPLGRADPARPPRAHRRLEARRPVLLALPGPPGAPRAPSRLGRPASVNATTVLARAAAAPTRRGA